jgi:hypothetical protein
VRNSEDAALGEGGRRTYLIRLAFGATEGGGGMEVKRNIRIWGREYGEREGWVKLFFSGTGPDPSAHGPL